MAAFHLNRVVVAQANAFGFQDSFHFGLFFHQGLAIQVGVEQGLKCRLIGSAL